MDWSLVVPTVVGGVLAIGGGFVGQWWSQRSALAREAREREHEREVWARSLRYEAHVAFLTEFDRMLREAREERKRLPDWRPGDAASGLLWDRFQALRLVCAALTTAAAESAVDALRDYLHTPGGRWRPVDVEREGYLAAVRDEFGLPPVPPLPTYGGSRRSRRSGNRHA